MSVAPGEFEGCDADTPQFYLAGKQFAKVGKMQF